MGLPTTNKALRFSSLGGDLEILEKQVAPLPANEILVKVHAASINPCDIQLWRSGLVAVVAGDKGMGKDFSGTVVGVGSNVNGWAEGDEIFGLLFYVFGQSTFSEYINVNPASDPVAKKPGCFTHEEAASIPLVALTAYACLEWLPPPGEIRRKVVIRGASGGTGTWLVQLAKVAFDCHITAICSGKNADFVKSLGADEVIDYTKQDISRALASNVTSNQRYDLIVDCVGGIELLSSYQEFLQPAGAYVTIVGDKTNVRTLGGPITYLWNPIQIFRYLKGYLFGPRYACVSFVTKSSYLEDVVSFAERGEVKAVVQEVLDGLFDEREAWREAARKMEEGRVRGKVVLTVT
ncbi:GroES-like protein [Hyaloscypha hepaticicola]|uniref:GroES-like protein n=1 Tax=Hyaloscypha hepaticicola TaxID=2082293 RepID=A0A2J6Q3P2_9HELO|nr:GroES-like protein [Hyaloscypha hepaticicola]